MRKEVRLTATRSYESVNLDFPCAAISIENPTASPVYIRLGAPDIPTSTDADRVIPAAESRVIAASGQVFGLALANPTLLTGGQTMTGGLFTVANVVFLSDDEITPSFGNASFLSLSTSQLSNGAQSFAPAPPAFVYDLGPWGGAIFYFYPTGGQTDIRLNVSNDGVTWTPLGAYGLWPGFPTTITVPRIMRYVNLEIFSTGIVGEPNPAGTFYVRGSLAEITQLVYTPTGSSLLKTFALGAGVSIQYQFITAGMSSVSIAAVATAGTGASAAMTFLVEASSDRVVWRQVTARTQRMSTGITLYRAMGNLDQYIRVTIFEVSLTAALNGSLYLSIPSDADLGSILNTIQQSIGDTGAPANTNQDVYHELDSMRLLDITRNASLVSIDTDTTNIDFYTQQMNSRQTTYLPYLAELPGIGTSGVSTATNTGNTAASSSTTATNTGNIKTDTASIASSASTVSSNTTSVGTNIAILVNNQARGGNAIAGAVNVTAGVWAQVTSVATDSYIMSIQASLYQTPGAPAAGSMKFALGTFVPAVRTLICYTYLYNAAAQTQGPEILYFGPRTGGLIANAFLKDIWVFSDQTGVVFFNIAYSA